MCNNTLNSHFVPKNSLFVDIREKPMILLFSEVFAMLYQPILNRENSLVVALGEMGDFAAHRHYETEIIYCTSGNYKIIVNNEPYLLSEGMLVFIPGFTPHEAVACENGGWALLIEAGPVFLQQYYDRISKIEIPEICMSTRESPQYREIKAVIEEIIRERENPTRGSDLIIQGSVAKLFGLFLNMSSTDDLSDTGKDNATIGNIEKVLDLVHHCYSEKISVDTAADVAGYGKSNFCKIFKNSMGISFHKYLNNYRVERAKFYLKHTDMTVLNIAESTGFSDSKTFCRVFKEVTGKTPKEYSRS